MKKTKLFGVIAVLGISLAGLVACGDKGNTDNPGGGTDNPGGETPTGKTINLTFSGPADKAKFDESLINGFKEWRKAEGDPNTYVVEQVNHGEDKVDSEVTDWTAGPDVYCFAPDKIANLYSKGALAKLAGSYKSFVEDNQTDVAVSAATFNGDIYAFPYTADNTYYLQYDKSIFSDEDVKTVEGILAKCADTNTNFAYKLIEGFYGQGALFTYGADYNVEFTEDGQIKSISADFNLEKGLKAAKGILNIITNDHVIQEADIVPNPTENGISIAVLGTWKVAEAKETLGDNYGVAPLPSMTVDGTTANLGCFVGAKLIGVNPQRSNGDNDRLNAAYLLAQYLSDEEAQVKRFQEQNIGPCNINAVNSEEVKNDANMQVLTKQAAWGHVQGAVPPNLWTASATLITGMQDGTTTLDNLQAALDIYNDTMESLQTAQ